MRRSISVQTYLPPHVADWVGDEAGRVNLSRSLCIGKMILGLYQGQEMRDEARKNAYHVRRQLTFITCALDGLLVGHRDPALRERVHESYARNVEKAKMERGK